MEENNLLSWPWNFHNLQHVLIITNMLSFLHHQWSNMGFQRGSKDNLVSWQMVDTYNAGRQQGARRNITSSAIRASLTWRGSRRGVLICQMCLFPVFLWFHQMVCISYAVAILWNFWCKRHFPVGILTRPWLMSLFWALDRCSGCPPSCPPPALPASEKEGHYLLIQEGGL